MIPPQHGGHLQYQWQGKRSRNPEHAKFRMVTSSSACFFLGAAGFADFAGIIACPGDGGDQIINRRRAGTEADMGYLSGKVNGSNHAGKLV